MAWLEDGGTGRTSAKAQDLFPQNAAPTSLNIAPVERGVFN